MPAYDHDIFISYAHLNNDKFPDQKVGWVENFYKCLKLELERKFGNRNAVKIWLDNRKMDGGLILDPSIERAVNGSAIMICLISFSYLGSAYCLKESELFYKKVQNEGGIQIGDRPRLIKIFLNNIPNSQLPIWLQDGAEGFKFYEENEDVELCDPTPNDKISALLEFRLLRNALYGVLKQIPKNLEINNEPDQNISQNSFNIFFGEVCDTLSNLREQTIGELKKKGFNILTGDPPPYTPSDREKKVKEDLKHSALSVHLFDKWPGRHIETMPKNWYPKRQAELSLELARTKMFWMPNNLQEIEESEYQDFLNNVENNTANIENLEFIKGQKSDLTREITGLIAQIKSNEISRVSNLTALLDYHSMDAGFTEESKTILEVNDIIVNLSPDAQTPKENKELFEKELKSSAHFVAIYGNVSHECVDQRIQAAAHFINQTEHKLEYHILIETLPKRSNTINIPAQNYLKINIWYSAQDLANFIKGIR